MISNMLVLYNCVVVKVVFVVHLRIVSISFVFSKTWSINPLKPFGTCQSISDKNDICLVIVYFVLLVVCLFAIFLWKCAYFRVSSPAPQAIGQAASSITITITMTRFWEQEQPWCNADQGKHTLPDILRTKHLITKSPFHLIPEQGMLIVSVSLRSH